MKALAVPPLSVPVLLRGEAPDYGKAKHEIDEVIAHPAVVRAG